MSTPRAAAWSRTRATTASTVAGRGEAVRARVAALLVAGLAALRGLDDGSGPADERPSVPPTPGVVLALPAAEATRACPGVEQRRQAGDAPQPFPLSVFARPQTEGDALPSRTGTWIPAGTIFAAGSRRAGAELHLVPIAEPRRGGGCDGELQAALGVCLAVDAVVKCFTDEEVEAGRALAVTSPGVVHGIAPDGVGRVTLHSGGKAFAADVHENAYEVAAPVAVGEDVRVELERLDECRPSSELLEALPALREGAWQALPGGAGLREWARRVETGDALELWGVAHCDGAERACVVAVHGGKRVAEQCATAVELRAGPWATFPVAGGVAIAGMAPPGTRGVQFVSGDRVRDLPFAGGVFGGLLSSGPIAPGDVRFVR